MYGLQFLGEPIHLLIIFRGNIVIETHFKNKNMFQYLN